MCDSLDQSQKLHAVAPGCMAPADPDGRLHATGPALKSLCDINVRITELVCRATMPRCIRSAVQYDHLDGAFGTIAATPWPSDANLKKMVRPTWPVGPVTRITMPFHVPA